MIDSNTDINGAKYSEVSEYTMGWEKVLCLERCLKFSDALLTPLHNGNGPEYFSVVPTWIEEVGKASSLERWPKFRGVLIEGLHCMCIDTLKWMTYVASTTTPTPLGLMAFSMASATSLVNLS